MVVPVDREGKVVDSTLLRRDTPSSSSYASDPPISTRKAGGRQQDEGPQTVETHTYAHTYTHLQTHTLTHTHAHTHRNYGKQVRIYTFKIIIDIILCTCRCSLTCVNSEVLYHPCYTREVLS